MKRQGDLLFIKTDTIPQLGNMREVEDKVILKGESTGHTHRLVAGHVFQYHLSEVYLILDTPSQVVHEEHNPIDLEPGAWIVRRQREYVAPDEERTIYD